MPATIQIESDFVEKNEMVENKNSFSTDGDAQVHETKEVHSEDEWLMINNESYDGNAREDRPAEVNSEIEENSGNKEELERLYVAESERLLFEQLRRSAEMSAAFYKAQYENKKESSLPTKTVSPALSCSLCEKDLKDCHFVQCLSVKAHKFCFSCCGESIKTQQSIGKGIYCPSGEKCFNGNSPTPWTFMQLEIDTIISSLPNDVDKNMKNTAKASDAEDDAAGNLSASEVDKNEQSRIESSDVGSAEKTQENPCSMEPLEKRDNSEQDPEEPDLDQQMLEYVPEDTQPMNYSNSPSQPEKQNSAEPEIAKAQSTATNFSCSFTSPAEHQDKSSDKTWGTFVRHCAACKEFISDQGFVLCRSTRTHRFCYKCVEQRIHAQYSMGKAISCPFGEKCLDENQWTSTAEERDTKLPGLANDLEKQKDEAASSSEVQEADIRNKDENTEHRELSDDSNKLDEALASPALRPDAQSNDNETAGTINVSEFDKNDEVAVNTSSEEPINCTNSVEDLKPQEVQDVPEQKEKNSPELTNLSRMRPLQMEMLCFACFLLLIAGCSLLSKRICGSPLLTNIGQATLVIAGIVIPLFCCPEESEDAEDVEEGEVSDDNDSSRKNYENQRSTANEIVDSVQNNSCG